MQLCPIRKRAIPPIGGTGRARRTTKYRNKITHKDDPSLTTVVDGQFHFEPNYIGNQVTDSENHPDWRKSADGGGAFTSTKTYAVLPSRPVVVSGPWIPDGITVNERQATVVGDLMIEEATDVSRTGGFPNVSASSDSVLNTYGATAIAKCAPAQPTVNLLAALAEAYHDGLPKMLGRETWAEKTLEAQRIWSGNAPKTAGSEFLNVQFGWLPLISDVKDFTKTFIHMNRLIKQYIRDNGRVVRRRWNFPPITTYSDTIIRSNAFPNVSGVANSDIVDLNAVNKASIVRNRSVTVWRWFSGAFVYHLPDTFFRSLYSPFADKFQTFERLFGLELTPDVIWELTPWSWAVDWFSNAGDVIHNTNAWANDGLVLKYGYIMEHTIARDVYTYVGPANWRSGQVEPHPPPITLFKEIKVRRAANPFGFGLTMNSLTGVQKAILAAVGLTRLR